MYYRIEQLQKYVNVVIDSQDFQRGRMMYKYRMREGKGEPVRMTWIVVAVVKSCFPKYICIC